ncbi:MAG: serine protease [Nannocystaceae bacterium]|nr:serine protease [Nannocystaceae bacterium]
MNTHDATPFLAALVAASCLGCQSTDQADESLPAATDPGGKSDSFEGDDRTSVLDSLDPRAPGWAMSVALLTTRIGPDSTAEVPTLGERFDLCTGERFASDPFLGHCTAFLVGPDLVATAAHCLAQHSCDTTQILFGFNDAERNDDIGFLASEDIYRCDTSFLAEDDDIALIRLDRIVEDRVPVPLGETFPGRRVGLVGHPLGGRATVDLSGIVESSTERRISTTLDTFSGHSGSPVFDLDSGEVVAIHTSGAGFNLEPSAASCSRLASCHPGEFEDCLAGATNVDLLPFE